MLQSGADRYNWNGGRTTNGHYVRVLQKGHPRADKSGYVLEHVLIAEKAIGRFLSGGEEVHHVNEVKTDNHTPFNLVICQNRQYHSLLHYRMRALKATGDAKARHCYICKRWEIDSTVEMDERLGRINSRHRSCRIEYEKNRQERKRLVA